MAINIYLQVLLPEAVCVVVYKLVHMVLTLEWHCVPVYIPSLIYSQECKPNQGMAIA